MLRALAAVVALALAAAGALLATARLEVEPDSLDGHPDAATLLSFAEPPYAEWSDARKVRTQVTRLDGLVAFADGGRLLAVARAHPRPRHWPLALGSALARMRSALWWLDPGRAPQNTWSGSSASSACTALLAALP